MAFKAIFQVDGKQFNMKSFHFSASQGTDATNKPAGRPVSGYMDVVIETSRDNMIWLWHKTPDMTYDGKVVFFDDAKSSAMKTITFKKGYCVEYELDFEHTGSFNTTTAFSVPAGYIDIDGVDDEKPWS